MPPALPIASVLPRIVASLREHPTLVIRAEPGAGKTTGVPPALLEAGVAGAGEIVVAQPRRIAARMAAQRVAEVLGERVGERCGFQVRFESKVSAATRIRFVTEGLLARRLRDDPTLPGVRLVILDEFHERHVDTDVSLALLRRLQRGPRPDLAVVAMSATMEAGPVADFLGASTVDCEGRMFPVELSYEREGRSERSLGSRVASAVRTLADSGLDGSVLVFLPGAREIREAGEACQSVASAHALDVVTLHGDLPAAEQDRAVRPGARPRIILSTNVAETSVTIDGVAAVVDSGLVRRPSHDPWSGIPTLTLSKISRASAEQRRGRAGRTRAGQCVRLYSAADLERRPAYDAPELQRLDLAAAMLDLRAAGIDDPTALDWLEPPPDAAREAAETLLRDLGALDERGRATDTGREMLALPVHPRLARLMVEARRRGVAKLGAGSAALLAERPLRRPGTARTGMDGADHDADVLADLADLDAARRDASEARRRGLDRGALHTIERARKQLERALGRGRDRSDDPEEDLRLALLSAYPDRVARAESRAGRPDRIVFAAGGDAELAPESVVHGGSLVLALAVEQRIVAGKPRTVVRSAAHIEPEWLLEAAPDRIVEDVHVAFDEGRGRVDAVARTRYDGLVIDTTPLPELPPEARAVLRDAALCAGPRALCRDPEAYDALLLRAAFVAEHRDDFPKVDEAAARETLARMCEGARSFADVRKADLVAHLLGGLAPGTRETLDRLAPATVGLAGGRRLRVHYEADRAPWVQSRLQDFFGSTRGPAVVDGRVPLVLHLLAPNQRAVQVTTDLDGFWERHYPELRRTLMRRYPKHAWPEDGRTASPPAPGGRGRRGRKR